MPAGLTIFNDNGVVQIDQDSYTLQFHSKGTQTLNAKVYDQLVSIQPSIRSGTNGAWINTNGVGNPPGFGGNDGILAFRANLDYQYPITVGFNPSGSRSFIGYNPGSSTPPVVDWWYFTRPAPRTSGFGLEVYKADGTVAYSSSDRPLALTDVANESTGGIVAPYYNNWAISVGTPVPGVGSYIYDGSSFHYQEYAPFWDCNGQTFSRTTNISGARTSNDSSQFLVGYGNIKATILLIDVSAF